MRSRYAVAVEVIRNGSKGTACVTLARVARMAAVAGRHFSTACFAEERGRAGAVLAHQHATTLAWGHDGDKSSGAQRFGAVPSDRRPVRNPAVGLELGSLGATRAEQRYVSNPRGGTR